MIQNITTVNNEVILSTQLDISNQGTGPALKVSQFGVGDDQDVALFNAGDEGDVFKIDSSGNSHFYKDVDVSGGTTTFQTNTFDISNEQLMFDTIVVRRPTGISGSISGRESGNISLRQVQLWINGVNRLPLDVLYDIPDNADTGISLGDVAKNANWDTKLSAASDGISRIAVKTIDNDFFTTNNIGNTTALNRALYLPLQIEYNINEIQTIIMYGRKDNREIGLGIELYNRKIDSNMSSPIISTPIIDNITSLIYRYDFPSLPTYSSFVSSDSISNIIDSANSAVYHVLSKKDTTYSEPFVKVKYNEDERMFDTLVIRRPTGFSGGGTDPTDYAIVLNEIQCWVNAINLLTDANTTSYFADWAVDKDVNIGQYQNNFASKIHNNIIEADFGAVSPFDRDENLALIISGFPTTDINKIQSMVVYNRQDGGVIDRTIGLALELYNRENDANLETSLASTNEITSGVKVYRFDFAGIGTYNKAFVNEDSITNIVSNTYALTEISEASTRVGLKIENAGLRVDRDLSVGGLILAPNQVSFKASRSTDKTINTGQSKLPFDIVIFNNGNGYDNTTYTFTAPVTGIYFFYSQFFSNGNNNYFIDFFVNGETIHRIERSSNGTGNITTIPTSFTTHLNSGDEVYLKRYTGSFVLYRHPFCCFGGHLLA